MNNKLHIKCFGMTDQMFFAQRLSLLLHSGISMMEALSMMRNIESSKYRKQVYDHIIQNIEQGISLCKSLKGLGMRFNDVLMALIRIGEEGGHLADALSKAYIYLEKRNEMKKKIISSLVYPGFIVSATVLMTLFLILYIFPKIIPLLQSLDIELPLITRIVQGIYYFLISYGAWVSVFVVVIFICLKILISKNSRVRYMVHLCAIRIPVLNTYMKIHRMASIASMGEMLLTSGKGLIDVLIFSRDSSRNILYREVFDDIHSQIQRGISFSKALIQYKILFPQLLIDMVALGEKTGSLSVMLGHCSKIFEQDIDNALKRFSSLIEPLLMVCMGLIVGSIALSIILPVYEITNHLSK